MLKYFVVLLFCLASCRGIYPLSVSGPVSFEVKCVSPGTNGLCIYYLRSDVGRIRIVDSNDKYKLGDVFMIKRFGD